MTKPRWPGARVKRGDGPRTRGKVILFGLQGNGLAVCAKRRMIDQMRDERAMRQDNYYRLKTSRIFRARGPSFFTGYFPVRVSLLLRPVFSTRSDLEVPG